MLKQHFGPPVVDQHVLGFLAFEQCYQDHLIEGWSYEPLNQWTVVHDLGIPEVFGFHNFSYLELIAMKFFDLQPCLLVSQQLFPQLDCQ